LFEITPVLLGDDPSDPKNKIWQQHFDAVRFWNRLWMIFASKRSLGLSASAIRVRPSMTPTPPGFAGAQPRLQDMAYENAQMLR